MALTKVQADGVNLGDTFAFTGNVTGAGGLVLLSTVTVTTAVTAVDFDNISTSYDTFYVDYSLHPATDNVRARVNFLNSSGVAINTSTYAQTAVLMDNMTYLGSNSAINIPMNHTNMGNAEIEGISGYFYLRNRNYDNSVSDQFVTNVIGASNSVNTSGGENHNWYAGYLNNNTEVRGFRITFTSGNIDEGYARLYGVAK